MQSTALDASPFWKLPLEIREKIFEYLLCATPIEYCVDPHWPIQDFTEEEIAEWTAEHGKSPTFSDIEAALLGDDQDCTIHNLLDWYPWRNGSPELKIIFTCRQFHREALHVLFENATFVISAFGDTRRHTWGPLVGIGKAGLRAAFERYPSLSRIKNLCVKMSFSNEMTIGFPDQHIETAALGIVPMILARHGGRFKNLTISMAVRETDFKFHTTFDLQSILHKFAHLRADKVTFEGFKHDSLNGLKNIIQSRRPVVDFTWILFSLTHFLCNMHDTVNLPAGGSILSGNTWVDEALMGALVDSLLEWDLVQFRVLHGLVFDYVWSALERLRSSGASDAQVDDLVTKGQETSHAHQLSFADFDNPTNINRTILETGGSCQEPSSWSRGGYDFLGSIDFEWNWRWASGYDHRSNCCRCLVRLFKQRPSFLSNIHIDRLQEIPA